MNRINKLVRVLMGSGLLALGASAQAMDASAVHALAAQKACLGCHAADKKIVGPAYQDVAAKYKGMDVKKLAGSIKAGGSGKWGAIPMPPQPTLSDAEAELLAAWVLAGAPAK